MASLGETDSAVPGQLLHVKRWHFDVLSCNFLLGNVRDAHLEDLPGYYPSGLTASFFERDSTTRRIQRQKIDIDHMLCTLAETSHAKAPEEYINWYMLYMSWLQCFGQAQTLLRDRELVQQYHTTKKTQFGVELAQQCGEMQVQNGGMPLKAGDIAKVRYTWPNFTSTTKELQEDHDVHVKVLEHDQVADVVLCQIIHPQSWLLDTTPVHYVKDGRKMLEQGTIPRKHLVQVMHEQKRQESKIFVHFMYGHNMGAGNKVKIVNNDTAPWFNDLTVHIMEYHFDRACWKVLMFADRNNLRDNLLCFMVDPRCTDAMLRHSTRFMACIQDTTPREAESKDMTADIQALETQIQGVEQILVQAKTKTIDMQNKITGLHRENGKLKTNLAQHEQSNRCKRAAFLRQANAEVMTATNYCLLDTPNGMKCQKRQCVDNEKPP